MGSRNTILETLKTDLDKINPQNDYATSIARIERGAAYGDPSSFPERPMLAFDCIHVSIENRVFGGGGSADYTVILWGIIDQNPPDFSPLDNFLTDVLVFLESEHFTYQGNSITNGIDIWSGNPQSPVGYFVIEIVLKDLDYLETGS